MCFVEAGAIVLALALAAASDTSVYPEPILRRVAGKLTLQ
jgi:hypothetical protein